MELWAHTKPAYQATHHPPPHLPCHAGGTMPVASSLQKMLGAPALLLPMGQVRGDRGRRGRAPAQAGLPAASARRAFRLCCCAQAGAVHPLLARPRPSPHTCPTLALHLPHASTPAGLRLSAPGQRAHPPPEPAAWQKRGEKHPGGGGAGRALRPAAAAGGRERRAVSAGRRRAGRRIVAGRVSGAVPRRTILQVPVLFLSTPAYPSFV